LIYGGNFLTTKTQNVNSLLCVDFYIPSHNVNMTVQIGNDIFKQTKKNITFPARETSSSYHSRVYQYFKGALLISLIGMLYQRSRSIIRTGLRRRGLLYKNTMECKCQMNLNVSFYYFWYNSQDFSIDGSFISLILHFF
jgi:hypothetical protein